MRTILATLQGDGYPPSAMVRLDGFPQLPVERFFVRLERVDAAAMSGLSRGFYGHVRSVRVDPHDGSWLVRTRDSDISVVITARVLTGSRLAETDPATLVDGALLVLGHPRLSQRSPGRSYIKVTDPNFVEIQAPARPARA